MLIGAALWRNPPPRPPPVQRFAVQVPIDFQAINNLSVSPDGTVLAFPEETASLAFAVSMTSRLVSSRARRARGGRFFLPMAVGWVSSPEKS